jgi:hypothetical protein
MIIDLIGYIIRFTAEEWEKLICVMIFRAKIKKMVKK